LNVRSNAGRSRALKAAMNASRQDCAAAMDAALVAVSDMGRSVEFRVEGEDRAALKAAFAGAAGLFL
jgi:hypothetical protein